MANAGIDRVMDGYTGAYYASEYADAIVLDDELISGDNYRMVWTTEYSGDYPQKHATEE